MRLTGIELIRVAMPLRTPFRTSFGTERARDVLLVRAEGTVDGTTVVGWGECVAGAEPRYSPEYVDGAEHVITHFFAPRLFDRGDVEAENVGALLEVFEGHPMAKAALEMAVLDAELRAAGRSFAEYFGAVTDRVPAGVSVGITDDVAELLEQVAGYLDDGYLRIKLKIEPGLDVDRVAAVRERFGDDLVLQVDANAAYTLDDADHLAELDAFDLLLVEQPLAAGDLRHHSLLATADAHADLPRRVDHLGEDRRRRHRPRRVHDRQHQGRESGWLHRGQAGPRHVPGPRRTGVVRRDAGDRTRPRGQRLPGGDARIHPARRHVGVGSLLGA